MWAISIQTPTQVQPAQEMTLTFVPKMIAVFVAASLTASRSIYGIEGGLAKAGRVVTCLCGKAMR